MKRPKIEGFEIFKNPTFLCDKTSYKIISSKRWKSISFLDLKTEVLKQAYFESFLRAIFKNNRPIFPTLYIVFYYDKSTDDLFLVLLFEGRYRSLFGLLLGEEWSILRAFWGHFFERFENFWIILVVFGGTIF